MRQVALQVLQRYPFQVKEIRFLAKESNTHYTVITNDNQRYVLRIYSDMETTQADNLTELFWLRALQRDTDLCVTEPIPDCEGRYLNLVCTDDRPAMRCVVFSWVPGRSLSHYLSPRNYEKFGWVLARLHQHAETLQLPETLAPRRWDRLFYFPDEPDLIHHPKYRHLFHKERIWLLDKVMENAQMLLDRLYSDPAPILIHSDLHMWNVRLHKGSFCLMDFEAVLMGYPVQDVAITLYYGTKRDDYAELSAAFQQGYSRLRPWPIETQYQLETLWAARMVNFINYSARIEPDPREYIRRCCADLWDYLERFG